MSHSPFSADGPSTNGDLDPVAMLVGRFETLWFAGHRPALEPLLAEAGAARRAVLIELVHAELEFRLKAGEAARVEDYLQRYPELSEDPAVELDLIRAEVRFRARREQQLDLKEFQLRFPHWQLELEQLETPQSPSQKDTQILPAKRDPAVGEWPVIPGMEVLAELGSGGMGIVYKVRQTILNRYAAVKILRPGAREEERRRFRTEAEAAARLNHPRIARIHEVGECEGQPYLVLEYVEGGNLAQRLDGTPWPIREAAELVLHLAEAVQYAHDQGVLHRDLTPANVLLDSNGLPKISDFGLAKILVSVGVGPTRTEAVLGTPSYMSPEQASGAARQVGPATDIYGLGAILYHLLTARPVFKGETSLETLRQVLSEDPLPPHRLRSSVPPDLETICLKCLEKQVLDRYSSAANLASDLRSFLAGEPIKSRPPSRPRLAWRWARKHPATTSLVAAGLLLAVVVVAGSLWHSVQLSEALEDTQRASSRASENEQQAQLLRYASDIRLGYLAFKFGDVFLLNHLVERHTTSLTEIEPPSFEWRYLSRFRQSDPHQWRAYGKCMNWIDYSPNGRLLATGGDDPGDRTSIKVWDATSRKLLARIALQDGTAWRHAPAAISSGTPCWLAVSDGKEVTRYNPLNGKQVGKRLVHSEKVNLVAVSSDGKQIITGGEGPITVWDVATEKVIRILPASQHVAMMTLTEKDQTLLTFQGNAVPEHKLWNLATGDAIATPNHGTSLFSSLHGTLLGNILDDGHKIILRDASGRVQEDWLHLGLQRACSAAISSDGRLLVVGFQDGGLRFYDLPGRKPYATLQWQSREITSLRFAPDDETVTAGTTDGTVYQVNTPKQQDPDPLGLKFKPSGWLACSLDGKTIAFADWDRTIKLLDVQTAKVRSLVANHHLVSGIVFSFDGHQLATLSPTEVYLWDTATGNRLPMQFPGDANCLAFSPTRSILALGYTNGRVELWDVRSLTLFGSLRAHSRPVNAIAFSPDGNRMASTSYDQVVHLWDTSGEQAAEKPLWSQSMGEQIHCLAFLLDGPTLLSAGAESKTVRFWHLGPTTLKEEKKSLQILGPIYLMDVAQDGRTLLTQGPNGVVNLWDPNTLKLLHRFPPHMGVRSARSDKFAILDHETLRIEVWDCNTWKAHHFPEQRLTPVRSLAFSTNDRSLFTGSEVPLRAIRTEQVLLGQKVATDSRILRDAGMSVREWNPEDGSERQQLSGPAVMAPPELVALSFDNGTLAAGGEDGCVYLWDRTTGCFRKRLFVGPDAEIYVRQIEIARNSIFGANPHYPESVRALAFCPRKELLVTASSRGVITLWDTSLAQVVRRFSVDPEATKWVGFSPDGDLVLSQGSQLKFQDPASGEVRFTLGAEGEEHIVTVAFAKGGSLVAMADQKHCIHVWDRQTGTKKGELRGHIDQVNALAFTPDSRTLASASNDRTVKLWSVAALAELASLEAHTGNVTCLAFNSAGTILATGGEGPAGQGQVFLWRAPPDRGLPR